MSAWKRIVIPEVLVSHAEDASFLWVLRTSEARSPHCSLEDLSRLDKRIAANLEGLRIAGDDGWAVVQEHLRSGGAGEVFTATVLALHDLPGTCFEEVLEIAQEEPSLYWAIVSGTSWLAGGKVLGRLQSLIASPSPALNLLGLSAAAARRADPGQALPKSIESDDLLIRARALQAAAELGRLDLLHMTGRHLRSEDPEVRFSAAWSTAVLSTGPEALSTLASIAQSDSRNRERALQTVMRRAEFAPAKAWLRRLQQDAAMRRLAVQAAGAIGDPAEIPSLIEQMVTPELARVAGESFTTITGVDIAYQNLAGARPEGFESGPTEDPDDENVEMDPDENLPWPDPKLIQKWWQSNRNGFQPGTRHLLGKPITIDWCKQVLRMGRQRQRGAAALELAMRQPGTPLFEVSAPGFRQKQLLGL